MLTGGDVPAACRCPSFSPAEVACRDTTPKILALTDRLGILVRFEVLPGSFDAVGVAPLIEYVAFGGLIADEVFEDWIVAEVDARGARARERTAARRDPPMQPPFAIGVAVLWSLVPDRSSRRSERAAEEEAGYNRGSRQCGSKSRPGG
jgi:hypothetical protein